MKKVKLTDKQHKTAIIQYDSIHMFTNEQVDAMVTKLLDKVQVPFISEDKEKIILAKAIRKIDRFVYEHLPVELYECIHLTEDGISGEDSEIIKERLIDLVERYVHLPFISVEKETLIFEIIIDSITFAIKKNCLL